MAEAHEYGFDFMFAKSERKGSHFSTLKMMKEVCTDRCWWLYIETDDHGCMASGSSTFLSPISTMSLRQIPPLMTIKCPLFILTAILCMQVRTSACSFSMCSLLSYSVLCLLDVSSLNAHFTWLIHLCS